MADADASRTYKQAKDQWTTAWKARESYFRKHFLVTEGPGPAQVPPAPVDFDELTRLDRDEADARKRYAAARKRLIEGS